MRTLKRIDAWPLLLVFILSSPAWGQDSARIGYVNWDEITQSAPQIQYVKDKLTIEFDNRKNQIADDEETLSQLEERLVRDSSLMTDSVRIETERSIRELRRKVQRDKEDLRVELEYRLDSERQQVEDEIYKVVTDFAQENGYDLIIPGPALYASDSINLTEQLLERLRVSFEQQSDLNQ